MQIPWRFLDSFIGLFLVLCVADLALELGLLQLLRVRHREFWLSKGAPKVSLWGYVRNSFNARSYVMSRADRDRHDGLLTGYCWVYRSFSILFLVACTGMVVGFLISMTRMISHR